MQQRRARSSLFGGATGVLLCIYGLAAICGYDVLARLPPAWEIGATAIVFGILLVIWAFSEKLNLIGGETVSMVVGVIVALIVISSFVRETQRPQNPIASPAKMVANKHQISN